MRIRNLVLSVSAAALTLGTATAQTTVTRTTRTTTVHHSSTASTPRRVFHRKRVVRRPVRRTVRHAYTAPRDDTTTTTTTTTTSTEMDRYPERYYREGPQYQERTLASSDRVYAGEDGRYYCRRSDGTTGLIVGGVAGGVLGNVIAGKSSTLGTLLGAAGGALAGRAVEQGASNRNQDVRCR